VYGLVGNDTLVGFDHGSSHYCWSSVAILQTAGPVVPDEHSCWSDYSGRCPCVLVPLLEDSTSIDVETVTPEYKELSTMLFTLTCRGLFPDNC